MDHNIEQLEENGINTTEGLGYTGNRDKYISALQRYYKGYENNKKEVEKLLETGDIEGYTIRVHSLKSNSRMIGAIALGDAFEELEIAGRNYDLAMIKAETPEVLSMYGDIIEAIKEIGEGGEVKPVGEISAKEAEEIIEKLLEALDDFDDELSKELAGKLKGFPFRMTQKEKLNEAIDLIDDFMYDEAAALIKEIEGNMV